ncbi:MAG: phytanoyl-CoA dioxygenase family protein [Trichodesmium sp. MO_231.B1]|nr:phytanoyl-CoA dioxygenase family protein [Trichodesmium sp. MO_231.B1]
MTNSNILSSVSSEIRTTRPLSQEQVAQYHEDGFVIIPKFFDVEEIEPVRKACEEDPTIKGSESNFVDSKGHSNQLAYWTELGNSLLGVIPRLARMVDSVELLLGGKECYHWHSKVVKKRAYSKGFIEWHSGYGSWYYDSCLFPDFVSVFIAVDANTRENACVQIVKKSHLMGRIDHALLGEAFNADPIRMKEILEKLEVVHAETKPGDTILMHANTIHASGENLTDRSRTNLVCHYNSASNEPVDLKNQEHHQYKPLKKLPDSWILDGKYNSVFDTQEFVKAGESYGSLISREGMK